MTWLPLIETDFITDNDVVGADRAEGSFAIYKVDGAIYVTDNLCTHGNARLCDGFLEGHEIECPLHQGRFDIRTGTALCARWLSHWCITRSKSKTTLCALSSKPDDLDSTWGFSLARVPLADVNIQGSNLPRRINRSFP